MPVRSPGGHFSTVLIVWVWKPEKSCWREIMLISLSLCSVGQSRRTPCDPITVACQALLSVGFSRQEYWSELLFSFPRETVLVFS